MLRSQVLALIFALAVHQLLEGLALGSVVAAAGFDRRSGECDACCCGWCVAGRCGKGRCEEGGRCDEGKCEEGWTEGAEAVEHEPIVAYGLLSVIRSTCTAMSSGGHTHVPLSEGMCA